jgi:hypothetical protein
VHNCLSHKRHLRKGNFEITLSTYLILQAF